MTKAIFWPRGLAQLPGRSSVGVGNRDVPSVVDTELV
jgi:hypothetical protein